VGLIKKILSFITALRCGWQKKDFDEYPRGAEAFVRHYVEQIRIYESLAPLERHLNDATTVFEEIGSTAWGTVEFALCAVKGKTEKEITAAEIKRNKRVLYVVLQ
jgi:hypothetical protein